MRGLVLLVALWHYLLSCGHCRVMEGVGGERYLEQQSASRGRALGVVEGREEVRRFLQFCEEADPMVLCRFLEFGGMGEAQQVEHSQNSAAS
jgi:hypothetical protein